MNPIRILHVVRAGRAEGGMENGIVNLVNRMDQRFALSVCALDSEETFSARISRPGARCFVLPPRREGMDWSFIHRLVSLIRREQIDIIHSHNWGTFIYSVLAGRLAGVGIIHGEHGKNFTELGAEGRAKRLAKTWLGREADLLLCVCDDIRGEWLARYAVAPQRIRTIHNGVDSLRFAPAPSPEARRALGLPQDAYVAGTVGSFDPIKNQAALMGAVARLAQEIPALHAVFIGSGRLEAELRQMAEASCLSGRIHFPGLRRNVEQLLPAFDVFVLPSISEGMSNVLLEAMSCGVPPICTDLASHREIVTPGLDAILLQPCNEVTLAEALRDLHLNEPARFRLADSARRTILERFTLEGMIHTYEEAYVEVMSRRGGG
jgi:glycosyltransferase involved in cell wall biosynthesis